MDGKTISVPIVVKNTPTGERSFDIFSALLNERILFVTGVITDEEASLIIAQLLLLEAENPNKEISMYISCMAGYPESTLAVYDTMKYIRCDITTICMGECSPMGTFLLAGGTKGKRRILPNASVVIEQFSNACRGSVTDIELQMKRMSSIKETMNEILAKNTGHTVEEIRNISERRYELTPQEAISFGVVDSIIQMKKPTKKPELVK